MSLFDTIQKQAQREKHPSSPIPCKGSRDYWGEYDCSYEHAGDVDCDECVCNGGPKDPRTGKKYRAKKARKT